MGQMQESIIRRFDPYQGVLFSDNVHASYVRTYVLPSLRRISVMGYPVRTYVLYLYNVWCARPSS